MVVCSECGVDCYRKQFSKGQLQKEYPRCYDCTQGGGGYGGGYAGQKRGRDDYYYECEECGQTFHDQNALDQHRYTHRARSFPCPGCGKMYRGMTDAAMHFESGSCDSCRGKDNARRAAYQLVANQRGGSNFLARPQLLTFNGSGFSDSGGGYSDVEPNYKCSACGRHFHQLSSLMQHQQNRSQCTTNGQHVNARIGYNGGGGGGAPSSQRLKFFHGTTWENALRIERDGFLASESGCLGHGIYVAREDKATKFAEDRAYESVLGCGGLVELLVTVRNPKYVLSNDYYWQSEGYDACRAERTSASTNMEWCIRDADAIEVIRVTPVYL